MARCSSIAHPHEADLSRLLMAWLCVGFLSLLGPGVLVGLIGAFGFDASPFPAFGSPEWIRQHAHAQMFGWMGSFIWGISLFAVPRLRNVPLRRGAAWLGWVLWSSGLAIFFAAPLGGARYSAEAGLTLQTVASVVLLLQLVPLSRRSFRGSHPSLVLIATGLWLLALAILIELVNSFLPVSVGVTRTTALLVSIWCGLATVTWGYAARWLPAVVNLRKAWSRLYPVVAALQLAATLLFILGRYAAGSLVVAASSGVFLLAVRIFERGAGAPRIRGVHHAFPYFVRLAHIWFAVSIVFSTIAFMNGSTTWPSTPRHLFTVGYLASMILAIGPRMLPSFVGRVRLFSTSLMGVSMLLMALGCSVRAINYVAVPSATQSWFVFFAPLEVAALLLFVVNAVATVFAVPTMDRQVAELIREREAA